MLDGSQEQGIVSPTEKPKLPADLEERYQTEKERISDIYSNVWAWHGTGRYEQTDNGIRDTLAGMLDTGELSPHHDAWNGSKAVETISVTESRPYATLYSDVHLQQGSSDLLFKDERTPELVRKTLKRTVRHLPSLILHGRSILRQKREAKRWMEGHTGQQIDGNVWRTAAQFGKLRSALSGDYPILIGFTHNAFEPMRTAGYLQATEVRTDKPVSVAKITHLEVPIKYVEQTEALLQKRGVSIPVIARELGERFSTEIPAGNLISGKGFTKR